MKIRTNGRYFIINSENEGIRESESLDTILNATISEADERDKTHHKTLNQVRDSTHYSRKIYGVYSPYSVGRHKKFPP